MWRAIVGAVSAFVVWNTIWLGSEKLMSAIWPEWYGTHQTAFEMAVTEGGDFKPDTSILVLNIVRAAIVSVVAGWLASIISGESRRAPKILTGC